MRVWLPLILLIVLLLCASLGHGDASPLAAPFSPADLASAPTPATASSGVHLRIDPVMSPADRGQPLTFLIDAGNLESEDHGQIARLTDGFAMQIKSTFVDGMVVTTYLNGTQAFLNTQQGLTVRQASDMPPALLVAPGHPRHKVVLRVDNAILTTCDEPIGHRHYEVHARILYLFDDNEYLADDLSFFFAGRRLFTLAHYHGRIARAVGGLLPTLTVGTSMLDGTYLGVHFTQPLAEGQSLDVVARIGTVQLVRGTVAYSHSIVLTHDLYGNISLVVGYREDVANSLLTGNIPNSNISYGDLTVTRLPAVLVTLAPIALPWSLHGFSLSVGGGLGEYHEQPTDVSAFRSQAWGILGTPRYHLGPLDLYGEFGARGAFYWDSTLATYVEKVTLETPLTSSVYANLSYYRRRDSGVSPFLFDQALLPDELYAEVSVPLGKSSYRLDVLNHEDLSNWSSRDIQIGALYSTDCMSLGLYYDTVTQGVGLLYQFAGKGPYHRGVPGVGFTQ